MDSYGRLQNRLAQQYSEGSPLDAAIYGLLIVAGVLVLNFRAAPGEAICCRTNLPLLLFFAYCALSIAWSEYSFIALKRWSKSVGDLVMVMLVVTDPYPLMAIRRVFARVAFVLLPLSVLFIECYPDLGTAYSPEDSVMMYFGVTTFKNLLGMISMVFGLASLWSFLGAFEDRSLPHRSRHLIAHAAIVADSDLAHCQGRFHDLVVLSFPGRRGHGAGFAAMGCRLARRGRTLLFAPPSVFPCLRSSSTRWARWFIPWEGTQR